MKVLLKILFGLGVALLLFGVVKLVVKIPVSQHISAACMAQSYDQTGQYLGEVLVQIDGDWKTSLVETKFDGMITIDKFEISFEWPLAKFEEGYTGSLMYIKKTGNDYELDSAGYFEISKHFEVFTFYLDDGNTIVTNEALQ